MGAQLKSNYKTTMLGMECCQDVAMEILLVCALSQNIHQSVGGVKP